MPKPTLKQQFNFFSESLFDCSIDTFTIKDSNLNYLYCNKAFFNLFKIKDSNFIINKSVFDILPENNSKIIKKYSELAVKEKTSRNIIINFSEAQIIHLTIIPVYLNTSSEYLLTIGKDITSEENLKIRLFEKIRRQNQILENLPIKAFISDINNNITEGNINPEEAVNYKAVSSESDNYVINKHTSLIKHEILNEKHYKIFKKPLYDENNNINAILTTAENIDEQIKIEEQKELYTATLIHDLKNPLIAQINSLSMLLKGIYGNLNKEQTEIIEIITESSNFMKDLLQSMLAVYKFDNGYEKLDKSKFNSKELIEVCIKEISGSAVLKNVKISFSSELNDQQAFLIADRKQIRRVISNILNNMVNYAFENTSLKVELKEINNNIIFSFSNISPKISDEIKDHIFEKYISGSQEYKKIGFGLGLYLSKKIIDAHNGHISLISNNTNNTFTIEIPSKNYSSNEKKSLIL